MSYREPKAVVQERGIRIEGNPLVVTYPPELDLPLVCKSRGSLRPGDVVYHDERFFKVDSLMVHAGHGAVIEARGHYKDRSPAVWSFNDFSGANCYVLGA